MSTSVSIDFLTLPPPDAAEATLTGSAGTVSGAPTTTPFSIAAPPASAIQMELNSTEDEEDDDDDDDEDDDVPGAAATAGVAADANGEDGLMALNMGVYILKPL